MSDTYASPGPVPLSLGFMDLFLSPSEKQNFSEWQEKVQDKSVINQYLFSPIFEKISDLGWIGQSIAPNCITLFGLLSIVQNWYFCINYGTSFPGLCSSMTILALIIYWVCHGLDSKHAKRMMNDTPLGELFKYMCDSMVLVFLVHSCTYLFAPGDLEIQWLGVHTGQIVILYKHFSAFHRDAGMRYWFFGPGEVVSLTIYLLSIRTIFGVDTIIKTFLWVYQSTHDSSYEVLEYLIEYISPTTFSQGQYQYQGQNYINNSNQNLNIQSESLFSSMKFSTNNLKTLVTYSKRTTTDLFSDKYNDPQMGSVWLMKDFFISIYCITFLFLASSILWFKRGKKSLNNNHTFTRTALMLIMCFRMVPTFCGITSVYVLTKLGINPKTVLPEFFLIGTEYSQLQEGPSTFNGTSNSIFIQNVPNRYNLTTETIILDGLFMSVCVSDVVLAKMARRELHQWVVLMCFSHALPFTSFVTACMIAFYFVAVLGDLSWYLNIPLLSPTKNVYCDGVYDLCHIGHKTLFRSALRYGNRLFVGVCGDADCAAYKRPPIMSHEERCNEILGCKAVTKVIPNAPTFGITFEFLKKHQIHIVCCGQEYIDRYPDPKNDPYYRVPRELGIARPLPRYQHLSTSDLINRIQKISKSAFDRNDKSAEEVKKEVEKNDKLVPNYEELAKKSSNSSGSKDSNSGGGSTSATNGKKSSTSNTNKTSYIDVDDDGGPQKIKLTDNSNGMDSGSKPVSPLSQKHFDGLPATLSQTLDAMAGAGELMMRSPNQSSEKD